MKTTEAIARLRETATKLDAAGLTRIATVRADDLRALLDAHAALEAAHREVTDLTGDLTPEVLTRLSDVQGYVRRGDRAALSVDYARGVADERARVVAWLRDSPKAETEARHYVDSLGAAHLALAIERGEHESEGT